MEDKKKAPEEATLEETEAPATENQTPKSKAKATSPDSAPSATGGPVKNPIQRLSRFANLYLIIFLLVLLIGGAVVYIGLKFGNKSSNNQANKNQTLSTSQLAALKGSTTIVGDSQQTLDIQGNSVFEGQVLLRNNLDVAGSIKVGGSLSLPAITVGGTSSFGTIQVNDTLAVTGSTILGQVTIQKSLAVAGNTSINGTLSAGQINVSSLQLTGDLQLSHHITLGGGTPSRTNGGALGGGGTASLNGTDTAGTVTINTGGGPVAGCFITVNFVNKFNSTPHVVISPSNAGAGSLQYYANRSTTSFSICTNNAPAAGSTYLFDYIVID